MKTDVKVGLFSFLGLILFLGSVLWLGGDKALFARYYRLNLVLESVEGLGLGSVVQLSGLKVGNIESLSFVPEKSELIAILRIEQKFQNRITIGSTGGVRTQGALGDKFVYITPGPMNAAPIEENGFLVTESNKDLISTITQRGNELQKVFDILAEMKRFAEGLNSGGGSRALMNDLSVVSKDLHDTLVATKGTMQQLQTDVVPKLGRILDKVDRGQGTIGSLINDPSLHQRLKDFLGASEKKSDLKRLIKDGATTKEP